MNDGGNELRIVTKGRRRDRFYLWFMVIFWIVWAPMTVGATCAAIANFNLFWAIWLPFGYFGTFVIPAVLLNANKAERIYVDAKGITVHAGITSRRGHSISKENLEAVTLERYEGGGDEPESVFTLNIIQKTGWLRKRTMLAWSLHPDEKQRVYLELTELMRKQGLEFRQVNTYGDEHRTSA